jgi:hypothetical protein
MFGFLRKWWLARSAKKEEIRRRRENAAKFMEYVSYVHAHDPQKLGGYYEALLNAKAGDTVRLGPYVSRVLGNRALR